ncbi:preprotein translocase subunit YajC [Sphingomonas montanisoli]|uniref:Preprotein translocase subunit YajC n=1 Tax=Sphingomonas montanisoli TaxID=2606412 RepID=A0A5D9CGA0_9SPHN|nr:preprotein translocase subunit YajC [Sphingomonas montanisoli]TZG29191.1 preprotein translocase subunit YajC [Sphingomonas montanisoli]
MTLRAVFLASAFLTAAAAPALAQDAAAPAAAPATAPAATATANVAAGATVTDVKGGAVGTIASTDGTNAVIDTGVVKATVPVSAFAKGDKALLIGMTKAELEAAAKGAGADQQAEFLASLQPGTTVSDPQGGAVGKIEAIEGENVVVATANAKAKLPKSALAKGPNGAVIGMTAAQLEAAAKGAAAPAGQN